MLHFRRMLAPQLARAAIAMPARATSLRQTASLSSVSGDASPPTAFSPLNTSFQTIPPFSIIDTTLREGEQFATTEFTQHDRVYIAKLLDQLGVEYIELVNPIASKQVRLSALEAEPRERERERKKRSEKQRLKASSVCQKPDLWIGCRGLRNASQTRLESKDCGAHAMSHG